MFTNSETQVAAKPGSPESLQQLVEIVKNPAANVAAPSGVTVGKDDKARQSRDKKASVFSISVYFLCTLQCLQMMSFLLSLMKQAPVHSPVSREDFSNVESTEPDPAGFREQVS